MWNQRAPNRRATIHAISEVRKNRVCETTTRGGGVVARRSARQSAGDQTAGTGKFGMASNAGMRTIVAPPAVESTDGAVGGSLVVATVMLVPARAGVQLARNSSRYASTPPTWGAKYGLKINSDMRRRSVAARSFVGDVALTVAAKGIFVALGFLTTIIVARGLGPTGQGAFAVAFNLTLLL